MVQVPKQFSLPPEDWIIDIGVQDPVQGLNGWWVPSSLRAVYLQGNAFSGEVAGCWSARAIDGGNGCLFLEGNGRLGEAAGYWRARPREGGREGADRSIHMVASVAAPPTSQVLLLFDGVCEDVYAKFPGTPMGCVLGASPCTEPPATLCRKLAISPCIESPATPCREPANLEGHRCGCQSICAARE